MSTKMERFAPNFQPDPNEAAAVPEECWLTELERKCSFRLSHALGKNLKKYPQQHHFPGRKAIKTVIKSSLAVRYGSPPLSL